MLCVREEFNAARWGREVAPGKCKLDPAIEIDEHELSLGRCPYIFRRHKKVTAVSLYIHLTYTIYSVCSRAYHTSSYTERKCDKKCK